MEINFIIDGPPKGKGRPRFTRDGHTYTPAATREYEQLIRACWQIQNGKSFPQQTPLKATILAYFPIPKGTSKKKLQAMIDSPCTKKPDADNVAKIILDALNGFAFQDDNAIYALKVFKYYSDKPRVCVCISDE